MTCKLITRYVLRHQSLIYNDSKKDISYQKVLIYSAKKEQKTKNNQIYKVKNLYILSYHFI